MSKQVLVGGNARLRPKKGALTGKDRAFCAQGDEAMVVAHGEAGRRIPLRAACRFPKLATTYRPEQS